MPSSLAASLALLPLVSTTNLLLQSLIATDRLAPFLAAALISPTLHMLRIGQLMAMDGGSGGRIPPAFGQFCFVVCVFVLCVRLRSTSLHQRHAQLRQLNGAIQTRIQLMAAREQQEELFMSVIPRHLIGKIGFRDLGGKDSQETNGELLGRRR